MSKPSATSPRILIADDQSDVLEAIARVGPSDANPLITGENGTGKGLPARRTARVDPMTALRSE